MDLWDGDKCSKFQKQVNWRLLASSGFDTLLELEIEAINYVASPICPISYSATQHLWPIRIIRGNAHSELALVPTDPNGTPGCQLVASTSFTSPVPGERNQHVEIWRLQPLQPLHKPLWRRLWVAWTHFGTPLMDVTRQSISDAEGINTFFWTLREHFNAI